MSESHWQVQEAKQRFSELLRRAQAEGAQFVTRHGTEVAVVLDMVEYRHLRGTATDFKTFLREPPFIDDIDINRSKEPARLVDLADD
jgi:prevent-host-death family protein